MLARGFLQSDEVRNNKPSIKALASMVLPAINNDVQMNIHQQAFVILTMLKMLKMSRKATFVDAMRIATYINTCKP